MEMIAGTKLSLMGGIYVEALHNLADACNVNDLRLTVALRRLGMKSTAT